MGKKAKIITVISVCVLAAISGVLGLNELLFTNDRKTTTPKTGRDAKTHAGMGAACPAAVINFDKGYVQTYVCWS